MESLYFLIPLSMVVVAFGLRLFFWAVNSGQYDDLDGEAERILFDELDTKTTAAETSVPATASRANNNPAKNITKKEND